MKSDENNNESWDFRIAIMDMRLYNYSILASMFFIGKGEASVSQLDISYAIIKLLDER